MAQKPNKTPIFINTAAKNIKGVAKIINANMATIPMAKLITANSRAISILIIQFSRKSFQPERIASTKLFSLIIT